ncbi:MAG: hypothetical protein K2I18_02460 [Paramuribaculum sp.]|nr:hypothetical protein [Paramuribaculum sp.]
MEYFLRPAIFVAVDVLVLGDVGVMVVKLVGSPVWDGKAVAYEVEVTPVPVESICVRSVDQNTMFSFHACDEKYTIRSESISKSFFIYIPVFDWLINK